METTVVGYSLSRLSLAIVKLNGTFAVKQNGIIITNVPNKHSGMSFVDGIMRCMDTKGKETFHIVKRKYFLIKNDKGSILIRTDDKKVAESFLKGYAYCKKKTLWNLPYR